MDKDNRELLQIEAAKRRMAMNIDDTGSLPTASDVSKRGRRESRMLIMSKLGGAATAAIRGERAKAGADKIKNRWGHPSDEKMRDRWDMPWLDVWPTAVLLADAGISRATAIRYLDMTREQAQEQLRSAERARLSFGARAAAEEIRADWKKPSMEFSTVSLLCRVRISKSLAIQYLGPRAAVQRRYHARMTKETTARVSRKR
jgi:hypothetical protein